MIKQLSSKIVYQNPWMKVCEDEVEFPNGHRGIYGVVDKSDFALIIPFDGKKLHLVQQYRYPTRQVSIEFPQGKHEDAPDEDATKMAKAELLEETGLEAGELMRIGFLHEAPGYSNQGFHIYFATQLVQKQSHLELTEAGLERLELTPQEFSLAVSNGQITDAPTIAAYGLLMMKLPQLFNQKLGHRPNKEKSV